MHVCCQCVCLCVCVFVYLRAVLVIGSALYHWYSSKSGVVGPRRLVEVVSCQLYFRNFCSSFPVVLVR